MLDIKVREITDLQAREEDLQAELRAAYESESKVVCALKDVREQVSMIEHRYMDEVMGKLRDMCGEVAHLAEGKVSGELP